MNAQRGTALTEFVIIMLFFTPVMIAMPLIAKYGDIKSKTIEASRYAAWERTVWSDPSARRNDGDREVIKTRTDLRREIDQRFFGNPIQGLHDATPSINFFWRNRHGEFMLRGDTSDAPLRTPRRSALALRHEVATSKLPGAAQIPSRAVDAVAFAFDSNDGQWGSTVGAGNDSIFERIGDGELFDSLPGGHIQCNPLGININDGLDLGARGFATAQVTMLANDYMHGDQPVRYAFAATSAVLGNAWSAPDEDVFGQRVDNMALGDMAGCVTLVGKAIGTITSAGFGNFLFGEGMDANPVEDFNSRRSADSRTLPRYLER